MNNNTKHKWSVKPQKGIEDDIEREKKGGAIVSGNQDEDEGMTAANNLPGENQPLSLRRLRISPASRPLACSRAALTDTDVLNVQRVENWP